MLMQIVWLLGILAFVGACVAVIGRKHGTGESNVLPRVGEWITMRLRGGELLMRGYPADAEKHWIGFTYLDPAAGLSVKGDVPEAQPVDAPTITIRVTPANVEGRWRPLRDDEIRALGLPVSPPWLSFYREGAKSGTNAAPADRSATHSAEPDPAPIAGDPSKVTFTERAATQLLAMKKAEGIPDSLGLRLRIVGGPASGFAYDMFFDEPRPSDRVFDWHGLRVVIDPADFQYVAGTVVDWMQSARGAGFKFHNPNATPR